MGRAEEWPGCQKKEWGVKHFEELLDRPLREILPMIQDAIVSHTTYRGVQALKCPTDAWVYLELLHELRPQVLIEIGTRFGGSALFLADAMNTLGVGRIIGVDIDHSNVSAIVTSHPRVELIEGDAPLLFERIQASLSEAERKGPLMIVEDSSHTYDNTLAVLRGYAPLVPVGSYFVVEDSICHHGLDVGPAPGPFEAVETFVAENSGFVIDRTREKFVITWNPKGFLRRVA
jgi:cephalosporin hydroxylase